ncbi:MAG: hypothetical protein AAFU73_01620 [Planctomycetota bacterium]
MRTTLRPHRARSVRAAGFSLLELIVLLTVLTAVASVGIPAYFGRASVTLDSAAELLAKDLREVQSRAALYQEELVVRFEPDGTGYRMVDVIGSNLVSPYGKGEYARDYPVDAVFRGVEIERAEPREMRFGPAGHPLSALAVVVRYKDEVRTVRMGLERSVITIEGMDEPWIDALD